MAFEVEKFQSGAGSFFKPASHNEAVAILVEVLRFEAQKPGLYGPKDTVYADLTVFKDAAALDGGTPELIKGALIQSTILAGDLSTMVGKATIVTVAQGTTSKAGQSPPWVWRAVDAPVSEKVVAYANKREEVLAAAMASAPDFDA